MTAAKGVWGKRICRRVVCRAQGQGPLWVAYCWSALSARIVKTGGPSHGSQAENRRTARADFEGRERTSTRIEHRFGLPSVAG